MKFTSQRLTVWLFLTLCALTVGCSDVVRVRTSHESKPRLFDGMSAYHRPISTRSPEAQKYLDQAMVWMFAFNHDEAIRSFTEAARLDPDCAMAYWGIALCHGPHINNPVMTPERSAAAWEALQQAKRRTEHASPVEQALIKALSERYANPAPADRRSLDAAYAEAMTRAYKTNPGDVDVAVLFAEAQMDLRPWDLWKKDGSPQPGTWDILNALEAALRMNPNHPGANHLYIHAIEASPHPERAIAAADRLRDLVPASGHLVHMPAHIDVRTGRWAEASECNRRAIKADASYRKLSPRQDFYRLYMAHNHHFLSFASMMEGRRAEALSAARAMLAGVPTEWAESNPAVIDPVMMIEIEAKMRFGMWDELISHPQPPPHLPITHAFWRFARGVAYAAKGMVKEANAERTEFLKIKAGLPAGTMMAINPADKVLTIAEHMLNGEIAFREGKIDEADTELRKAIAIEDDLLYMEPPDWIQPVRHTLGAILVSAGRYDEAEKVYREDLARLPENGWSLLGLSRCLHAKGSPQADEVEARLRKAWARSDMRINSSCLCVSGT